MAESIADCMPLALRSVGDAIRLDSENRTKEAYCQYLSCTIYISQVLKDDGWDKDLRQVYNSDTAKLFQLLQQCQERALTIISSFANGASASQKPDAQKAQGAQQKYSGSNTVKASQLDHSHDHLAPQCGTTSKVSDSTSPGSTLSTPSTDGYLDLPSPPGSPMPCHRRTSSYDPLEKAYQENKQLIAAYRERTQNSNKGRRNRDVIARNLGLMRRMSENLVIAKAREQAIKKKLLERQQRLQEETNRRFGPAVLSTKEQQDQRILYLKILEFEQETVWPKHLRDRLQLMPTDAKLIKEIITKIFSSADHPLTQFLLQYQYYVYRKLAPLVKDVGFPDVKSGRKASSKESYIALSETNYDHQQPTLIIDSERVDEGDTTNWEQGSSSLRQADEDTQELPSESIADETVDESNKVVEDKYDEEGEDPDTNQEVAPDEDLKNVPSDRDNGGVSSRTDLETLKNLLGKDSSSDTVQTENVHLDESKNGLKSSTVEETDESTDLESYFQDLEDEMFGWESSEDDEKEKEGIDADNRREMTDEESRFENEEVSSGQIVETRTEDFDESTDINNEASSNQLDSSEVRNETSSDQTSIEDTHEPDQIEPLREKDTEPQAEFDGEIGKQPTEDTKPLETNDLTSRQEEQCTGDRTTSSNSNDEEEAQQIEPGNANEATHKISSNGETLQTPGSLHEQGEEKEGAEGVKDKEDTQTPELPQFEERSSETKHDAIVPPTDEVRKHLKDIFVDVRFFLENLQKLLILAYEPLDTAAGRDLCYSCLEFPFFKPLWPMLLAVLRQVNFEKEITLADVMSTHISEGPLELGVAQRLCMEDQEVLESTGNKYPYQLAVEELHKVVTLFCPLEKLECLVRTSRCICQCVEDYWESTGKPRHSPETAIGCDDLLPILSFVIIRSGMAQLVSECDAMEEFIPEGYLMGEEGYCLTTLITALAYLATLKPT